MARALWTASDDGTHIYSEDFTEDAMLELSGDFGAVEDRKRFADRIAHDLNEATERRWQPIDTAPRDGTRVLTYGCGYCDLMHWNMTRGKWHDDAGDYVAQPTHWMPLPAPPARGEA